MRQFYTSPARLACRATAISSQALTHKQLQDTLVPAFVDRRAKMHPSRSSLLAISLLLAATTISSPALAQGTLQRVPPGTNPLDHPAIRALKQIGKVEVL